MGERLILVWAAIVMGTSSVLHAWAVRHDPPFPLSDDSLLAEIPWPDRETITVIRPPGRAAYWDPWHQHMVVGHQWDQSTWTRRHIVAHELAHAQQSSWRLRLADGWLKGVLTLSVLLATVLPPEAAWPLLAGGVAGLGDAVARWPIEMQADRQAGQRLALTVSEGSARDAVTAWSVRLVRRPGA